jgi:hypothetical protein
MVDHGVRGRFAARGNRIRTSGSVRDKPSVPRRNPRCGSERLRRFGAVSCPIRLVAATPLPERCGRPSGLGRVTEIEAPTIGVLYRNHQLAISLQRVVVACEAGIRCFSCSKPGKESMKQSLRRQGIEAHPGITGREPPRPAARLQNRAVRGSKAAAERDELAFGEDRVNFSRTGTVLEKTHTATVPVVWTASGEE